MALRLLASYLISWLGAMSGDSARLLSSKLLQASALTDRHLLRRSSWHFVHSCDRSSSRAEPLSRFSFHSSPRPRNAYYHMKPYCEDSSHSYFVLAPCGDIVPRTHCTQHPDKGVVFSIRSHLVHSILNTSRNVPSVRACRMRHFIARAYLIFLRHCAQWQAISGIKLPGITDEQHI